MSTSDPAARAAELRELLGRALIAYHVDDEPIMKDEAYDRLYDDRRTVRKLERKALAELAESDELEALRPAA